MKKLVPLLFAVMPFANSQGYYRPVAPQPQSGPPCGVYMGKPCPEVHENITIPPGATAEQIFQLGNQAFAQKRKSASAQYMQRAAEMGHTRAQAALGLDYVHGNGVPQDAAKAIYWLTKAADKGHRVAQAQLGDLYEDGPPVPADYPKGFHYHQLGAAQGWWMAELRLGLDYELGYGTPHNRPVAMQWLQKSMSDGQDGLSQDILTMLGRSDTPARFANEDALWNQLGRLRADAMPKWTHGAAGGPCRNHGQSSGVDITGNCAAGSDKQNGTTGH